MSVEQRINKRTFPKVKLAKCVVKLGETSMEWNLAEMFGKVLKFPTELFPPPRFFLSLFFDLFVLFCFNSSSWPRAEQGQRSEPLWPNDFIEIICGGQPQQVKEMQMTRERWIVFRHGGSLQQTSFGKACAGTAAEKWKLGLVEDWIRCVRKGFWVFYFLFLSCFLAFLFSLNSWLLHR